MLMSNGRCLKDYPSLPQLDISDLQTFQNRFIVDEMQYNKEDMAKEHNIFLKHSMMNKYRCMRIS